MLRSVWQFRIKMRYKIWKTSLETHDVDLKGKIEEKELRKGIMGIIG